MTTLADRTSADHLPEQHASIHLCQHLNRAELSSTNASRTTRSVEMGCGLNAQDGYAFSLHGSFLAAALSTH